MTFDHHAMVQPAVPLPGGGEVGSRMRDPGEGDQLNE